MIEAIYICPSGKTLYLHKEYNFSLDSITVRESILLEENLPDKEDVIYTNFYFSVANDRQLYYSNKIPKIKIPYELAEKRPITRTTYVNGKLAGFINRHYGGEGAELYHQTVMKEGSPILLLFDNLIVTDDNLKIDDKAFDNNFASIVSIYTLAYLMIRLYVAIDAFDAEDSVSSDIISELSVFKGLEYPKEATLGLPCTPNDIALMALSTKLLKREMRIEGISTEWEDIIHG